MNFYEKYTENNVFENPELNVFLNQLYTFLVNNIDPQIVKYNLMLDGEVALLLQKEPAPPFSKIKFTITHPAVFTLLKTSVKSLDVQEFQISQDKILIKAFAAWIEFSLLLGQNIKFDYNGITLRKATDIIK